MRTRAAAIGFALAPHFVDPARAEVLAPPPEPSTTPGWPAPEEASDAMLEEGTPASPRVRSSPEAPESAAIPAPLEEAQRDYNAPDPHRDLNNHVRAFLGGMFANYGLWQLDWALNDKKIFFVTRQEIDNNFQRGLEIDSDFFRTNFFGHPYQGSMSFGAARGAGLSYFEALPYPWANSLFWEFFAETEPPSTNDLIWTSWGGTVLGEALFRLSNELLRDSDTGITRVGREAGAFIVSPGYGLTRLTNGHSWKDGPPPLDHRFVRVELFGGMTGLTANQLDGAEDPGILPLIGFDVRYGDYLPREEPGRLRPYESFDLYAAISQFTKDLEGAQIYIEGPMYGWNVWLHDAGTRHPDNDVVAVTNFYDFFGADIISFGGTGIGVGDYLVLRPPGGLVYRLSANLQYSPLTVATAPDAGGSGEFFSTSMGGTTSVFSRLEHPRFGELGLRGRQYLTTVIAGDPGTEFFGYMRFWYKLPITRHFGLGGAAYLVHRSGRFEVDRPPQLRTASFGGELFGFLRSR